MADEAPECTLSRVYVKDISFESPHSPQIFNQQWQPKLNMQLNNAINRIDDENYEVVLNITLTARNERDTAFIIEVQQAGLFRIRNIEEDNMPQVLHSVCPQILFPYCRETVDSLAVRGSFPSVMLAAVNFDAVFQQALQQRAEGAAAEEGEAAESGKPDVH